MKLFKTTILILISVLAISSCAQPTIYNNFDEQRMIREAWLRVNYPGVTEDEHGLFQLTLNKGNGQVPSDSSYIFYNLSVKSLDGTYLTTNIPELAKKLRTYSDSTHYVPHIVQLGTFELYDAVEKEFCNLPSGSKVSLLVPPEKSIISYPKEFLKLYGLTNTNQATDNQIFEYELIDHVLDIDQYQISQLEAFARQNFINEFHGRIDSTSYGFYFTKIKTNSLSQDTIPQGTTVLVNYVGKFIDNFCFDTNIQDTAKFYRKYSPDMTYEPLEVAFYSDYEMIIGASSVVPGFAKMVSKMKYNESAIGFFISDLGYGDEGNGDINGFSPLFFYIEVLPESAGL